MEQTPGQVSAAPGRSPGAESRTRARALAFAPLLLAGVLLTACSGGSSGAGGPDGTSPTAKTADGRAFAKCMREHGVEKFPDPGDDGGLLISKDSGIDPKAAQFKKATEACKDLMPQGVAGPKDGKPADLAKARAWAKCIRDQGVPDFPDPEKDGNTLVVDMTGVGTGSEDPTLDKAMETCLDKRPTGNLMMRQNGGGQ